MSASINKKSSISIIECPPPLLTVNGKRRGRKPGANSTLAQRSAANSRERSRMRVLSSAFIDLKGALPWVPKDTKLSKLDTLKLAAGYIAYLKSILMEDITGTGTHLPPPWSVYDIYSPHAINSSNKCSVARIWSPNQSGAQLHQNCQSEVKMNYSINNSTVSSNNAFQELIDVDSTNQTDRFNQTQFYYRTNSKNNYFL